MRKTKLTLITVLSIVVVGSAAAMVATQRHASSAPTSPCPNQGCALDPDGGCSGGSVC